MMFSLSLALTTFAFATSAAAQGVVIAAPAANTTLSPGQNFTIEVQRPNTLTGSQEVAVAIGILSCTGLAPAGTCTGVNTTGDIGSPLYSGLYSPVLPDGPSFGGPSQNFTGQVPKTFTGPAILSVAHLSLIEGTEPFFEVVTQQVQIGN